MTTRGDSRSIGVGHQVYECVARVAVRSDRRKENKGTMDRQFSAGDHRKVAMHHATNTYGALQVCLVIHRCVATSTSSAPKGQVTWPLFNHLDAGPSLLWRATLSYSMFLTTSEAGLISFTPFGIAGERRERVSGVSVLTSPSR